MEEDSRRSAGERTCEHASTFSENDRDVHVRLQMKADSRLAEKARVAERGIALARGRPFPKAAGELPAKLIADRYCLARMRSFSGVEKKVD